MPVISRFLSTLLIAVALLAGVLPQLAEAAATKSKAGGAKHEAIRMYRYTNDEGVTVTASTIAPEYARKGYQVVNMSGVVLETIPPEPTAEERLELQRNEQNKLSAAQQLEQDKQLLLRYSSLEDLKAAKERKLAEIDNKIKMLQVNVFNLDQQTELEQQKAANYERSGQPVPPMVLKKIEELQQERKVLESQQASRQQELIEETARFDREIERYGVLEQKKNQQ